MEFKHIPIMLSECVSGLNIKKDGIYVDATLGGAGHASAIASHLSEKGTLIGIDKDEKALEVSRERLDKFKCKKILVHSDFRDLGKVLDDLGIENVDGILADLGVSSYQIDEASRGFSYTKDAPLDMRMDTTSRLDAKYIVNNYKEADLLKILYDYGEENFAKSIVRNIIQERQKNEISTTLQLVKIIEKSYPPKLLHKGGSVAKKTFQALRIETNGELDSLKQLLNTMIDRLSPRGRLCIITFHSLEDRIVKDKFKLESTDCICPKEFPICVCHHKARLKLITKKPLIPSSDEQKLNSRSTSSKLRIAEKI